MLKLKNLIGERIYKVPVFKTRKDSEKYFNTVKRKASKDDKFDADLINPDTGEVYLKANAPWKNSDWYKLEMKIYDRIRQAWKKADKKDDKKGAEIYLKKVFQNIQAELNKEFKKEFPKGPFTYNQLYTSHFGNKISTAWDSWEYLTAIMMKKIKK